MKSLMNYQFAFVLLNVLIFVNSQNPPGGPHCLRGEDATKLNNRFVEEHNYYRSRHGTPPLELDQQLIEEATMWSQWLANAGTSYHSDSAGRYGENIYMDGDPFTVNEWTINPVSTWYKEQPLYVPVSDDDIVPPAAANFTQMVWKSSTKIGCGICAGPKATHVTCRYTPPGNVRGQYNANVLPVQDPWTPPPTPPTWAPRTTLTPPTVRPDTPTSTPPGPTPPVPTPPSPTPPRPTPPVPTPPGPTPTWPTPWPTPTWPTPPVPTPTWPTPWPTPTWPTPWPTPPVPTPPVPTPPGPTPPPNDYTSTMIIVLFFMCVILILLSTIAFIGVCVLIYKIIMKLRRKN